YTNNTLNSAYGMWAFKFSNTTSGTYKRGIKSGHHFTWQGQRIVEDAYVNLLANKPVKTYNRTNGSVIIDGIKSNTSAWVSDSTDDEKSTEIDLQQTQKIGSAVIYSGSDGGVYTSPDRIRNFSLQYWHNQSWKDIPQTVEKENRYAQAFYVFKDA